MPHISQLRCLDFVQEHNCEQSRHYLHQKPVTPCSSPEKRSVAKARGKALRTATVDMVEDCKEGMNKWSIEKKIQVMKVEFNKDMESLQRKPKQK